MIEADHPNLSIRRQCELLGIPRSSYYYEPCGETPYNLELMRLMDELFLEDPVLGVLRMTDALWDRGHRVNEKRVRRLMRKMGMEPIYPKRNLSKLGKAEYVHPYLLRDIPVEGPDQVWGVDITYIPMERGFMYLTGLIDHYSRYIVGWELSNSLEKEEQTRLLDRVLSRGRTPSIINSDQGSQYTTEHWTGYLRDHGIEVSMAGKGRATAKCYIERFFRTLKWDHIYLRPADTVEELYLGIEGFMEKYNKRRNQGIGRKRPVDLYENTA